LVGKPEWRRPLGIPRGRWKDNIKTCLKETGWEAVVWFHVVQFCPEILWQALLNTVMNFGFHKSVDFLDWLNDC
jgi:hypothetical protein